MGLEIRKVPANWKHPRKGGTYKPLYDEDFNNAAREWLDKAIAWDLGNDEAKAEHPFYWQWGGGPPEDAESYRPAWTDEERTHFQVYETVSEGTPTSPVFASLDDLEAWLVREGHSKTAAHAFAVGGWAPSGVISNGVFAAGIDSLDL